jgi:hypothetical protein
MPPRSQRRARDPLVAASYPPAKAHLDYAVKLLEALGTAPGSSYNPFPKRWGTRVPRNSEVIG